MAKSEVVKLTVEGIEIRVARVNGTDYISLTDIARKTDDRTDLVLQTWMRNMATVEYLGLWEQLYNSSFNPYGFAGIKNKTGSNSFYLSVTQWIQETNAIGIQSKTGRYGGTFAHKDIAIQFCYWLSPSFQLYFIREFQQLHEERQVALQWDVRRLISKTNYHIHTDAVRNNLIPLMNKNTRKEGFYYASEADVLNLAVFGVTAAQWKIASPQLNGNLRDHASHEQLIIIANLEAINAELIRDGLGQEERAIKLNEIAIYQMEILSNLPRLRALNIENNSLLDK
jgi:KilA-N domain